MGDQKSGRKESEKEKVVTKSRKNQVTARVPVRKAAASRVAIPATKLKMGNSMLVCLSRSPQTAFSLLFVEMQSIYFSPLKRMRKE